MEESQSQRGCTLVGHKMSKGGSVSVNTGRPCDDCRGSTSVGGVADGEAPAMRGLVRKWMCSCRIEQLQVRNSLKSVETPTPCDHVESFQHGNLVFFLPTTSLLIPNSYPPLLPCL
jgi:hypothetical protein